MAYNQQPYYNGGYYPQYQNGAMSDMLNQYKWPYQQMPQMPQPMPQQMQPNIQPVPTSAVLPKITNDIIWVQGEAGAKGYLVAPNNTVVLWDTEKSTIYVKSADGNGIPSMRILDFKERTANMPQDVEIEPKAHACKCGDKFVTKDDFNDFMAKFEELQEKCNELIQPSDKTKTKITKKGDVE